jgi:hypothetical protein
MSTPKPPPSPGAVTDKEAQALLTRLRCPIPLHVVRTLFLGHIASPREGVSPMAAVAHAWGGEMPQLASQAEFEQVMVVLLNGLWNRLSEHQSTRKPFRLPRYEVLATRQALHHFARVRSQELQAFADGLFGAESELRFPQKAHEAVTVLAQLQTAFDASAALLADESKPAPAGELKALLQNLHQMTTLADAQINKTVQSCRRAREQGAEAMATAGLKSRTAAGGRRLTATDPDSDGNDEPEHINSPLSQRVSRGGVEVQVEIYGNPQDGWILEIVDVGGTSHVWSDRFETEQQALAEAMRALDEDPLEFAGRPAGRDLN